MKKLIIALLLTSPVHAGQLDIRIGLGQCYTDPQSELCKKVLFVSDVELEMVRTSKNGAVVGTWSHMSQPHDGFGGLGYDTFKVQYRHTVSW